MDECRALAILVDVLEIDDERIRVVFCVCKNLGGIECDDMVRDSGNGLRGKVVIIDAEMRVKPVHFIWNKVAWKETLNTRVG